MNQLNSPYLKDALCHVWLKLAKCFGEVSPPPQKKNHQPPNKQKQNKNKQNKTKSIPMLICSLQYLLQRRQDPSMKQKNIPFFTSVFYTKFG